MGSMSIYILLVFTSLPSAKSIISCASMGIITSPIFWLQSVRVVILCRCPESMNFSCNLSADVASPYDSYYFVVQSVRAIDN